jgi:hypothetical protein
MGLRPCAFPLYFRNILLRFTTENAPHSRQSREIRSPSGRSILPDTSLLLPVGLSHKCKHFREFFAQILTYLRELFPHLLSTCGGWSFIRARNKILRIFSVYRQSHSLLRAKRGGCRISALSYVILSEAKNLTRSPAKPQPAASEAWRMPDFNPFVCHSERSEESSPSLGGTS